MDAFKNLSPQQVARLIQYAEAGDVEGQIDGGQLHAEKNAPWVNGAFTHLRFPAWSFVPYPKVLYNAQWLRADEQYRDALNRRVRPGQEDDYREMLANATTMRASCRRIVENSDEEHALGAGWAETPALAVAAQEQLDRAVARAAAESNYDDRNLSALAKAERDNADAVSEGHLVEVPRTPLAPKGKRVE
jgi:hypothetical protein